MQINDLTREIIGGAIEVHRVLGPGLLEVAYEVALVHELEQRGLRVERQVPVPLFYKGIKLECGFRMDVLVERSVVVEVKAVQRMEPIFAAQLINYCRLSKCPAGLMFNFNVKMLRQGLHRVSLRNEGPGYELGDHNYDANSVVREGARANIETKSVGESS